MKYLGSKNRIAKYILPIMLAEAERRNITSWVEPFVGGANIIDKVPIDFERIGADINPHTIEALIAIRDLADKLPTEVSEEYYRGLKGAPPDPITSWIRYVCSYGGKFEDGYAREKPESKAAIQRGKVRNFAEEGRTNAQKQSKNLQGVKLLHAGYEELSHFENTLIYCDPPYQGTTSYKTEPFDHDKFYDWCRAMSEKNLVFVSEYKAPIDFKEVWTGEIKTNFASQRTEATHKAVEKLFTI